MKRLVVKEKRFGQAGSSYNGLAIAVCSHCKSVALLTSVDWKALKEEGNSLCALDRDVHCCNKPDLYFNPVWVMKLEEEAEPVSAFLRSLKKALDELPSASFVDPSETCGKLDEEETDEEEEEAKPVSEGR